jgi:hypothetical protein
MREGVCGGDQRSKAMGEWRREGARGGQDPAPRARFSPGRRPCPQTRAARPGRRGPAGAPGRALMRAAKWGTACLGGALMGAQRGGALRAAPPLQAGSQGAVGGAGDATDLGPRLARARVHSQPRRPAAPPPLRPSAPPPRRPAAPPPRRPAAPPPRRPAAPPPRRPAAPLPRRPAAPPPCRTPRAPAPREKDEIVLLHGEPRLGQQRLQVHSR